MKKKRSKGIFTEEQAKTEHQHSPRLAKALRGILDPKLPVSDFGCGRGEYIRHLKNFGQTVMGYEGTLSLFDAAVPVLTYDISHPMAEGDIKGHVLCLEVIEHIEKSREKTVIENLKQSVSDDGLLIISWAVEGQGGCGHINERNPDYVIPRIEKEGFKLNASLTDELRREAGADLWWFKKSIYVFQKVG